MIVKLIVAQEVLNDRTTISVAASIVLVKNQLFPVTAHGSVSLVFHVVVLVVGLPRVVVHCLGAHRWQLLQAGA